MPVSEAMEQPVMPNSNAEADWQAAQFAHLSAFSFGTTAFSISLGAVLLPVLILGIAGEDLKNTYLGLLGLVGLLVAMVVQPIAGNLSDRTSSPWGRRIPYLVIGSALTSASMFVLGIATSIAFLAIGIVIIQVSMNAALGPYQGLLRDAAPRAYRGAVSSFTVLAESSGGARFLALVACLLGSEAAPGSDSRVWLVLAILSATLAASTIWTVVATLRKGMGDDSAAAALSSEVGQRGAQTGFRWFLLSRLCIYASLGGLQTYALFFLRDMVGLANPVQAVGTMTLVTGGALLLAVYPFGRLSDSIGRKRVVVASALACSGAAFTLLLASTFLHVILISMVLGASAGAFFSANWAMATDMVAPGRSAQQMGIANTAAVAGSALAKLAGPGIDLLNRVESGLGYSTLIIACGLLFFAGAVFLTPVPRVTASQATAVRS
ncbi:MAG: MFS transporter [Chloroflexi bacterium]|nr:MFS transporter [Chloroflexota bacterium]